MKVTTLIQLNAICQDTCNLAIITSNLKVKSCNGTHFACFKQNPKEGSSERVRKLRFLKNEGNHNCIKHFTILKCQRNLAILANDKL